MTPEEQIAKAILEAIHALTRAVGEAIRQGRASPPPAPSTGSPSPGPENADVEAGKPTLGHFVWVMPDKGPQDGTSGKAANYVTRIETGIKTAQLLASELCDRHGRPTAILCEVEVYEPDAPRKKPRAAAPPKADPAGSGEVVEKPSPQWRIPEADPETVYSPSQACRAFGFSRTAIWLWVRDGRLNAVDPSLITNPIPSPWPAKYGIRHADLAALIRNHPEWKGEPEPVAGGVA